MRTLRLVGMAIVAVCAMSVAVVAQASAHSFTASAAGLLILDVGIGTHLFKTDAGTVECTKVSSHGKTTATVALTQAETVNYTGCKAFGSAVTITQAQYEFSADETVNILNNIVITSTIGGCSVKVGPTGNQSLKTVLYKTDPENAKAIIIKAEVKNISYLSSGGICGPTGQLTNGEYTGEALAFADGGGTIGWS